MKIIVMGGSFNPPTIAHRKLMVAALDALHADKGFYVPVSCAYLKRKMMHSGSTFCLSEALRKQMLEAMCEGDSRMAVCDLEYGIPAASTYQTMSCLQVQYPQAELYFLMGADKLELARQMVEYADFLSHFQIVMFAREGVSPMEEIQKDPILKPFAQRVTIVPQPEGIGDISSTAVREAVLSGKSAGSLMHPGAARLLQQVKPEDFPEEITRFREQYEFLDNLYPSPVEWEGIEYSCVEAAYQASKSQDMSVRKRFSAMPIAKLREKGSRLPVSAQWEAKRRDLMKQLVFLKFKTDPMLAQRLQATGNAVLICGNNGKDAYWGTSLYSWDGRNELGKILMEVRNEI